MIENRTYDEIAVGDEVTLQRVARADDFVLFAHASGNLSPLHLPGYDHTGDGAADPALAPAFWVASLVSGLIGTRLPGPGSEVLDHTIHFPNGPARAGDTLAVRLTVIARESDRVIRLRAEIRRLGGDLIAEGEQRVRAPLTKLRLANVDVPDVQIESRALFDRYVEVARHLPPMVTAVACPDDVHSLAGALSAAHAGLIQPILIGAAGRIRDAAAKADLSLDGFELIDIEDEELAAQRAVALVGEGRARGLMKGHLHSDLLLAQIVKRENGLRTGRRLSHVFVMDCPGRTGPLFISDAAINIAPDLTAKVDIIQNAIDLAHALGLPQPRVGVLSAIETVNPQIASSVDAAVLSKMAERGQITGGLVDGPLAMDNAVNLEAARTKGITSLVAGRAEVLIAPNLEAGNMLAKELIFLANANAAGVVLGARAPVIFTSRADDERARLASCAIAALFQAWQASGTSLLASA
jgi:phosphate butyryltransferase